VSGPACPAAIGIVLAGGAARRMQPPPRQEPLPPTRKEWLVLGGRTCLARVVDAVAAVAGRTLVVAAPLRPLPPLGPAVEVVHDSEPGSGPLAALLDGLRAAGPPAAAPVFVASCDLPLLRPDVVRLLVDRAAATGALWTVPLFAGHPQVLCSVLRPALAAPIAAWLAAGRRDPRGLLAEIGRDAAARVDFVPGAEFAAVDPALESFRDVDTPADLAALERQLTYGDRAGGAYTPPP